MFHLNELLYYLFYFSLNFYLLHGIQIITKADKLRIDKRESNFVPSRSRKCFEKVINSCAEKIIKINFLYFCLKMYSSSSSPSKLRRHNNDQHQSREDATCMTVLAARNKPFAVPKALIHLPFFNVSCEVADSAPGCVSMLVTKTPPTDIHQQQQLIEMMQKQQQAVENNSDQQQQQYSSSSGGGGTARVSWPRCAAACAAAVAGNINGLTKTETDIEFELGKISIFIDTKNSVHMKGPVSGVKKIDIKL